MDYVCIGRDEIFYLNWYVSFEVVFWKEVDWVGGGEEIFVGRFILFLCCIFIWERINWFVKKLCKF